MAEWSIRPFARTVSDARGILAVEQETFHECPYTPQELCSRLRRPQQRVWVAEGGGQVVGFVAGLCTGGLQGPLIEADLLAVRPAWQGRGIASALLAALRRDAVGVAGLRGVVRVENAPARAAFARAGFHPCAGAYDLLLYRILGRVPGALAAWGGTVRPLRDAGEAATLAAVSSGTFPSGERIWAASGRAGTVVLVANGAAGVVGGVELLEVHTLLYSGLWLERLGLAGGQAGLRAALIAAAVEHAKARGLDAVGCLAPEGDARLSGALLEAGFRRLDRYQVWMAPPLPAAGGDR